MGLVHRNRKVTFRTSPPYCSDGCHRSACQDRSRMICISGYGLASLQFTMALLVCVAPLSPLPSFGTTRALVAVCLELFIPRAAYVHVFLPRQLVYLLRGFPNFAVFVASFLRNRLGSLLPSSCLERLQGHGETGHAEIIAAGSSIRALTTAFRIVQTINPTRNIQESMQDQLTRPAANERTDSSCYQNSSKFTAAASTNVPLLEEVLGDSFQKPSKNEASAPIRKTFKNNRACL